MNELSDGDTTSSVPVTEVWGLENTSQYYVDTQH